MAAPRSSLSKRVTQGYWVAVRKHLEKHYRLSSAKAQQAIASYQEMLAKAGVGDELYHAPILETAEGVVNGGYVTPDRTASSERKDKKTHGKQRANS